jgi:prepilin-type N-terminal cleavage/methylation domain-containing protein
MREPASGFTLIEALVAVVLLSVIALALTSTLLGVQRAQRTSERWMQAVQLAADGIERLRSGRGVEAAAPGFVRAGTIVPVDEAAGLYRLEVTVTWNDGEPRRYALATLVRQ